MTKPGRDVWIHWKTNSLPKPELKKREGMDFHCIIQEHLFLELNTWVSGLQLTQGNQTKEGGTKQED